jgi:hypothetical protein
VDGPATRRAGDRCVFVIRAAVREGGRQSTCLTSVQGFPRSNGRILSKGFMTFNLKRGTIRAEVSLSMRFLGDGEHAQQTLRGTLTEGTGRYSHARGTITGTGSLIDTSRWLSHLKLTYRITFL